MPPGITNLKTPYAVGRVRGLKVGNARRSKIKWLKTCVFRRTFAHWRSIPSQRCTQHVIIIRKPSEKNLCRCVYTKLYRGISRKFWCMQVCGCVCLSVLSSVVRHSRTGASTKFCSPTKKTKHMCLLIVLTVRNMGASLTVRQPSNGSDDSVLLSKRLDRSHMWVGCSVCMYVNGNISRG